MLSNTTTSLSPPRTPPEPLSLDTNGRNDSSKAYLGKCDKLVSDIQTSTKGMEETVDEMSTTVEACRKILRMDSEWTGRNNQREQ